MPFASLSWRSVDARFEPIRHVCLLEDVTSSNKHLVARRAIYLPRVSLIGGRQGWSQVNNRGRWGNAASLRQASQHICTFFTLKVAKRDTEDLATLIMPRCRSSELSSSKNQPH